MLRSAFDRLAFTLRVLLRSHHRTIRSWAVALWVCGVVLALLVTAVLLAGELILYGFRDRPPAG